MNQEKTVAALILARGSSAIVADDVCKAIEILYVGASASGTVEVEAGGDILFKHGVLASEAADTSIKLPNTTSGAAGTIDVSDATADTLGEVVDGINQSANWKARIVAGLRTDISTDTFLVAAEASALTTLTVLWDTTTALHCSKELSNASISDPGKDVSSMHRVYGATGYSTYSGSGSESNFQVIEVISDQFGVVESETVIHTEAAGATTASKAFTIATGASIQPSDRQLGYKLIVRIVNLVAMASQSLSVDSSSIDVAMI